MDDLKRCDFDVSEIDEDPRFPVCRREAMIALFVNIAFTIVAMAIGYVLGTGDPTQYTYVMGFPSWYVIPVLVMIVNLIVAYYYVSKVFRTDSLEATIEGEGVK